MLGDMSSRDGLLARCVAVQSVPVDCAADALRERVQQEIPGTKVVRLQIVAGVEAEPSTRKWIIEVSTEECKNVQHCIPLLEILNKS